MDPAKTKASLLHFSEAHFEKNLSALKNTQESIQSLSSWCLQHKQHHKKIVTCWFKVMKKVKIECRLTLFYLANDVIQYSKRKNLDFVHTFALILQRAVPLVRDDKIKPNILRIFKIWSERGIFDEAFIADLTGLMESPKGVSSDTAKLIAEFQPMKLIDKVRSCKALEDDTDNKLSSIKESPLELTDVEALRNNLKDRRHGADLVSEVDDGILRMEAYVHALREEIKDRGKLIDLLEQGSVFYDHQKGEAKIVVNAYRNFGSRVKNLKRKLDELLPSLPSPVPSPDIDAPSPTPSDTELELPGDPSHGPTSVDYEIAAAESRMFMQSSEPPSLGMGSFMGSGRLPFDLKGNLFQETSQEGHGRHIMDGSTSSEGKPIEVIGGLRSSNSSNSKPDEGFNISDFLKSLGQTEPAEPPAPSIPGLDGGPVSAASLPVHQDNKPAQYDLDSFYSVFSAPPPPPPANMVSSVPLQPPPAPPEMFMQDNSHSQWVGYEDVAPDPDWNTKLPPKFPTWSPGDPVENWESGTMEDQNKWIMGTPSKMAKLEDTPMSPPMFEKEGFNEPVEYDDTSGTIAEDVDHRKIMLPHGRLGKKDVDHRNLISLTGSSATHNKERQPSWNKFEASTKDQDFRVIAPPAGRRNDVVDQDMRQSLSVAAPAPIPLTPASPSPSDKAAGNYSDNVESVDMEMSDEENEQDSQDSKRFEQSKKNNAGLQQQNEKNKGLNQQKNVVVNHSNQYKLNHSNGPQKNPTPTPPLQGIGPRPLMSPVRPIIPSLITGPIIVPPTGQSPATPKLPTPLTSKCPLLPTPPAVPLLQSPSAPKSLLQIPSPLPGVQKEPNFLSEKVEQKTQGLEGKNGEDWTSDNWEGPNDKKFVGRMVASDSFGDERNMLASTPRGRGQGIPQNRGRRGNQMGASNNYRGKPQGDFSQIPGISPVFPNRVFRGAGAGAYRPFRGARRGHFNRW